MHPPFDREPRGQIALIVILSMFLIVQVLAGIALHVERMAADLDPSAVPCMERFDVSPSGACPVDAAAAKERV